MLGLAVQKLACTQLQHFNSSGIAKLLEFVEDTIICAQVKLPAIDTKQSNNQVTPTILVLTIYTGRLVSGRMIE